MTDEAPLVERPKDELSEMASDMGLPRSGTKEVIAERIEVARQTDPYLAGTWHGKPNYRCPECPFSSVRGRRAIETHISDAHIKPAPSSRRSYLGLLGPDGEPI